jgi:hypothetical protein
MSPCPLRRHFPPLIRLAFVDPYPQQSKGYLETPPSLTSPIPECQGILTNRTDAMHQGIEENRSGRAYSNNRITVKKNGFNISLKPLCVLELYKLFCGFIKLLYKAFAGSLLCARDTSDP